MKKILTSILLISIFAGATLPALAQDQTNNASATINQGAAQLQSGSANIAGIAGTQGDANAQYINQYAKISQCQVNGILAIGIAGTVNSSICKK